MSAFTIILREITHNINWRYPSLHVRHVHWNGTPTCRICRPLCGGALLHSEWWPHPLCSIQSHPSRSNVELYALKQTVSAAVHYTYKLQKLVLKIFIITISHWIFLHALVCKGSPSVNQTKVIQHKTKLVTSVHSWHGVKESECIVACINVIDLDRQCLWSSLRT
jgi:hypothetical protein